MTGRYNRQRGGAIKSILVTLFVLALIAVAALAVAAWQAHKAIMAPGPHGEAQIIWVKPGSGVTRIADQLEEAGVISSGLLFKVAVRARDVQTQLQAAEYEIPAGASIDEIITILLEGKAYLHTITIAEGQTTRQILRLIADNEILEGEITTQPGEGTMLPETYAFPRGKTRQELVQWMMTAQRDLLDTLWANRADDLPVSTIEEAITLASIVEKETGVVGERRLVAGVFVNRLKRGMRLQSDPTIIYGLTGGEPLGRGIRQSELRKETPYNTYVINGLPPTPICNPGQASLAAVLKPEDTDYLFFVADGTGGHAFARTLREHNANVAKWRQIERARQN